MVGWLSALKVIPWGDVISAAPALAQGARKLFAKTQQPSAAPSPPVDLPEGDALGQAYARIHHLEQRLAQVAEQQQASAALVASLAEQNAQVLRAVDVLRARSRLLVFGLTTVGLALVGVAVWLAP